jgi:hypothetical protein
MKPPFLIVGTAALMLSLIACDRTDEKGQNVAADELNAMTNLEELAPIAPAENTAAEEAVTEASQPEPAAMKPAPAKPAPAKPMQAPAQPKPEPASESKTPDPACLPEHRAAGHC